MRQRLSWEMDKEKKAEMDKKADPYTMNQDHKNNPVEKYNVGGPSDFAEDPDMKTPWKTEGRTETGHPAPEREAVLAARKMEDKAMKCLTIAQRMLPGASDEMIEDQATEFMYMPEQSVMATLQRQASWAEALASDDEDEDDKKEKPEEEVEAKKAKKEEKEEPEEEVEAKKAKKEEKEEPEEEVEAKKAKKEEKEEPEEEKEEPEEEVEAKKKKADEEEVDLLDSLFASEETKIGAKKLSGIVKQASNGDSDLNSLWKSSTPPDVSEAFK